MDSAESEVCFPISIQASSSPSGRQAGATASRRGGGGRQTAPNLSHAYHAEMMEEEEELLDKRSPLPTRRPAAGRSPILQLEYSTLGSPSNHVVKFVDANNQEIDRKDYPSRSFIARI